MWVAWSSWPVSERPEHWSPLLGGCPPPTPLLASLPVAFVPGLGITLGVAQCKISQSMSELQT